ncbi:MAG: hypothetical protein EPN60_08220 [Nevskiaceae bacterium]|jgi:hypothetical protein|nr:MAG: hypothetical protein EPO48_10105 [Nevskiaceae bacterium]TAM27415.1 MAG: hypothetical protein EPN60_08220 [Nevskiaceae bacterium]
MDALLNLVAVHPWWTLLLLGGVFLVVAISASARRDVREEDDPESRLVPFYKRFNRRDFELGDRRKQELPRPGQPERRLGPRRDGD